MEDFDDDDTHFCLKCHMAITGLGNYITHRKNSCSKTVINRIVSPLPSQLLPPDESFSLKADDFFSSLELQSSSKKPPQQSTGGKHFSRILTRSKTTGTVHTAKEHLEPSKSGKNVWIGGHQLKELGCGDNQSKLIKAVDNLERRKEDITRRKEEIERLAVYEESEDESDDSDYDEETSDEDAPPRNHTGGKWKPSSPIYWKNSQNERDWRVPPPSYTGGKWKPSPSKQNSSPPPSQTKGKAKLEYVHKEGGDAPPSCFTGSKWSQNKKHEFEVPPSNYSKGKWKPKNEEDFPPSDHTKGKWKPKNEEYFTAPPSDHTKGKWKPLESEETESSSYKESIPDKGKTKTVSVNIISAFLKGKWKAPSSDGTVDSKDITTTATYTKCRLSPVPKNCHEDQVDLKIIDSSPFIKSSGAVQYWCRPCNRHLASKIVYERHLKSEMHYKRAYQEIEFEDGLMFVDDKAKVARRKTTQSLIPKSSVAKKRTRRKVFEKCQVCNAKVNMSLIGKHLISHYHCRKGNITTLEAQQMVLDNILGIILQSPFQCGICKFYFNSQRNFLEHWTSKTHFDKQVAKPGKFVCSFCKFTANDNDEMYEHLLSVEHNEVVSVINRSVPIVIKKISYSKCGTCDESFPLNVQLLKHTQKQKHLLPRDLVLDYIHNCIKCDNSLKTGVSLQRHYKNQHKQQTFICTTCNMSFTTVRDSKLHRRSEQHYYATLAKKSMVDGRNLQKKCQYCPDVFENFLKLKEHLNVKHVEFKPRCPHCGMIFTVPQELSVHLRTKSCKIVKKETQNSCEQCFFSSESASELMFHKILHTKPLMIYPENVAEGSDKKPIPQYECPECGKFFVKSSLQCHLRIHTKERPFSCDECGASFVRKSNWIFHVKKHKTGKAAVQKKVVCEGERPFLCSTCGASFRKKAVLQQHMKIHSGKLYKCLEENCMYAGRTHGDLKIHFQTHNNEKKFECTQCSYLGKTKQQLTRHSTVHDAVKKFQCPSCSFSARTSHHLKRHSLLHTGSKPYSCPHCEYKCNSLENLRKHILSTNKHLGKSIYECKLCQGERFQANFIKDFKIHLLTVHSKEMEKGGESFLKTGNYNKPVENNCENQTETVVLETSEDPIASLKSSISTILMASSNDTLGLKTQEEIFPMYIVSNETSCEEAPNESWNMVGCYDVEESGALVPFNNDENVDDDNSFFQSLS